MLKPGEAVRDVNASGGLVHENIDENSTEQYPGEDEPNGDANKRPKTDGKDDPPGEPSAAWNDEIMK
jgi:hypothetical protein